MILRRILFIVSHAMDVKITAIPCRVLITGIYGQIGRALAVTLLAQGYEVSGIDRYDSDFFERMLRIGHIPRMPRIFVSEMSSSTVLSDILRRTQCDYVVHAAAYVHVGDSFHEPVGVLQNNIFPLLHLLEAVRASSKPVKVLNLASAEVFGEQHTVHTEETPFMPKSPYAVSKVSGVYLVRLYRLRGIRAANAYLYNTESVDRSDRYVLRKITRGVSRVCVGLQPCITLGNLHAKRSWIAREDVIDALGAILQLADADDFIVAPPLDHQRTVREVVETVFRLEHMPISWRGVAAEEVGVTTEGKRVVTIDPTLIRPLDIETFAGDATKLHMLTGWHPKVPLDELIVRMHAHDHRLAMAEADERLRKPGWCKG